LCIIIIIIIIIIIKRERERCRKVIRGCSVVERRISVYKTFGGEGNVQKNNPPEWLKIINKTNSSIVSSSTTTSTITTTTTTTTTTYTAV
jgi:hypothetical protein